MSEIERFLSQSDPVTSRVYPTPVRGTTLGRFCTTWGLAPPRPIIAPIPPAPAPPPIGIGIIGIPPPAAGAPPLAAAISAAFIAPPGPIPAIAALPIFPGIEPCQVGGTDIAPTRRALPNSPDIPAPIPPPNPFRSPSEPAAFGASTRPADVAAFAAAASPADPPLA